MARRRGRGAGLAAALVVAALGAGTPAARAPAESPAAGSEGQKPTAPAAADCAAAVAAQVQARYDGVKALRARFTQTSHNVAFEGAAGPASEPARGRVEFAKPGRMRWEYETPEPSLVVSDGKTLWIYDPTAKEVQVLPVDKGFLSAAAIQFLLGEGRLAESFEVKATSCGAARAELELRPRAESSYERIGIGVDRATGWIRETEVVDLLGNRTQVAFDEVESGPPPPDARFRFEPPQGVRVLTLQEAP